MDINIAKDELSLSQVAIYSSISFLIVSLLGTILYVTCSKKYKLNWFEKNLLETASEAEKEGREILVPGETSSGSGRQIPCNLDNISECSRTLNKTYLSLTSLNDDPTFFWIPQRPTSEAGNHVSSSADESPPGGAPASPSGSSRSVTMSIGSGSVPFGRSDKHVILGMNPERPKVSTMHARLDHTKIDTSLYQDSPIIHSEESPTDLRGMVHLSIYYDPIAGILTIKLIEAQDLLPREFSGTADPYAKLRILPNKENIWQTRIHKKTLNPIFDEDFVFEERPAVICNRTLEVVLYDFDAYSRHVCIGGTQIQFANLDLSDKVDLWKPLSGCAEQDQNIDLGDLMVSLSYLPSAERLTVVVNKARNLRVVDDTRNTSDPFVKVSLVQGGKKIKKRKTAVIRNTVSPVFNEALTFDVSKDILKRCILEFIVLHDSLLGSNEALGRAIVGHSAEARVEERAFFDEMLRSKTATAQWIPLQDLPKTT